MSKWFQFKNIAADPAVAEIYILDFVGDWLDDYFGVGVTAKAFVEQLAALPDAVTTIHVHINSPGGDVQAGVNIANALRDQHLSKGRTVVTFIDGLAASIASVIAMAGERIVMADNALMMVHDPWTVAAGDAAEHRKTAEVLDVMKTQIVATYRWHSPVAEEALAAMMTEETWLDADEAIAKGLATEKVEGLKAAASLDRRALGKLRIPDRFRSRVEALMGPTAAPASVPTPTDAADPAEILALCRQAGELELAEAFVTAKAPIAQVRADVQAAQTRRTAAREREREIHALCQTARLSMLADGYVRGQMSVADVRAHLTTVTALIDHTEIDGALGPAALFAPLSPVAGLNPTNVYAARAGGAHR